MTDMEEISKSFPWHIQCLYLKTSWETKAVFPTRDEATRELHRYMVPGRDPKRYRIVNIHDRNN